MQLTQAQKTTLKAHMQANTNTTATAGHDGQAFVINTRLAGRDPTDQQAIADWYNGTALAGDAQPFANLNCWNPTVTVAQLNAARLWATPVAGADVPAQTLNELLYQSMIWNMKIDFTDPQVRAGVLQVFGNTAGGNASAVGGLGCGKVAGRRVELALSPAPAGSTTAWAAAHVCPKDAAGALVLGQTLQQPDVDDTLIFG